MNFQNDLAHTTYRSGSNFLPVPPLVTQRILPKHHRIPT